MEGKGGIAPLFAQRGGGGMSSAAASPASERSVKGQVKGSERSSERSVKGQVKGSERQ